MPDTSVWTLVFAPLIMTDAPIKGNPFSSLTLPVITLVCPDTKRQMQKEKVNSNKIFLLIKWFTSQMQHFNRLHMPF
jgi:hypothetical protein